MYISCKSTIHPEFLFFSINYSINYSRTKDVFAISKFILLYDCNLKKRQNKRKEKEKKRTQWSGSDIALRTTKNASLSFCQGFLNLAFLKRRAWEKRLCSLSLCTFSDNSNAVKIITWRSFDNSQMRLRNSTGKDQLYYRWCKRYFLVECSRSRFFVL